MKESEERNFCVAPMMGYTTPYARKLYRILSKNTFLFTEMIAAKSLLHSKNKDLIIENDDHNPVALQVGGSEIDDRLCLRHGCTGRHLPPMPSDNRPSSR